jgi:hypothetical protein
LREDLFEERGKGFEQLVGEGRALGQEVGTIAGAKAQGMDPFARPWIGNPEEPGKNGLFIDPPVLAEVPHLGDDPADHILDFESPSEEDPLRKTISLDLWKLLRTISCSLEYLSIVDLKLPPLFEFQRHKVRCDLTSSWIVREVLEGKNEYLGARGKPEPSRRVEEEGLGTVCRKGNEREKPQTEKNFEKRNPHPGTYRTFSL